MPLVAITREMGSLGIEVAEQVATELKVPLIHHEVTDHIADKMRLRKSHVIRLLDGKAGILERLTVDQTSMSIFTDTEIMDIASRDGGCVLRGWGATQLLRSVSHAVRVRICAPVYLRKRRMVERLNSDDMGFIDAEVKHNDEAHAAIIRRRFGVNWQDAEHYDAAFNTERVSVAECVDEILRLVKSPGFVETEQSRQRVADLRLAVQIKARLRENASTRSVLIGVRAEAGTVTLFGSVDGLRQRAEVERVVQAVPGVKTVSNELVGGMGDPDVVIHSVWNLPADQRPT
jgi:cytidylate kinase